MNSLLEIENLSKSYSKSLKSSMKYASIDLLRSSIGLSTQRDKLRESEFWALQNISFTLNRGEVLGIIGHNGAGKSTLLKCIANKIKPTAGEIRLNGTVGHMIEMSAGFDPLLTGRENVSLRGNILGYKGKSLQKYIDQVRDFADIDEFFDAPVQFYSSGMKSRLGFAASSSIEPDVLIIDEVLAVGDLNFRLQCYDRIHQLSRKCAVIFVSHSIGQLAKMCTRAIYLHKGKMIHNGDLKTALSIYQDKLDVSARNKSSAIFNPDLISFSIKINNKAVDQETKILYGDKISATIDVSRISCSAQLRILMRDASGSLLQDWNSIRAHIDFTKGHKLLSADLGIIDLAPGTYKFSIEVLNTDSNEHLCLSIEETIRVYGEYLHAIPIQRMANWSVLQ